MKSYDSCCYFDHPIMGSYTKVKVETSIREPTDGKALPFLKLELPQVARGEVLLLEDCRFLDWHVVRGKLDIPRIGGKVNTEVSVFGVFEDPKHPWVVVPMDEDLALWLEEVGKCGLWLLEISCGLVSVVWAFDTTKGKRIDIRERESFVRDFGYTFWKGVANGEGKTSHPS